VSLGSSTSHHHTGLLIGKHCWQWRKLKIGGNVWRSGWALGWVEVRVWPSRGGRTGVGRDRKCPLPTGSSPPRARSNSPALPIGYWGNSRKRPGPRLPGAHWFGSVPSRQQKWPQCPPTSGGRGGGAYWGDPSSGSSWFGQSWQSVGKGWFWRPVDSNKKRRGISKLFQFESPAILIAPLEPALALRWKAISTFSQPCGIWLRLKLWPRMSSSGWNLRILIEDGEYCWQNGPWREPWL